MIRRGLDGFSIRQETNVAWLPGCLNQESIVTIQLSRLGQVVEALRMRLLIAEHDVRGLTSTAYVEDMHRRLHEKMNQPPAA